MPSKKKLTFMLEVNVLKNNKEKAIEGLLKKHLDNAETLVEAVLQLDNERKEGQAELDSVLAESNSKAKAIGQLMKEGKKEEAEAAKALSKELNGLNRTLTNLSLFQL